MAKSAAQKIRRAEKRKAARLELIQPCEPRCVDCGQLATQLVTGTTIYPHRGDLAHLRFWLCECGARVGCHKGTTIPLGRPAGTATQAARRAAHVAFDPLWRRKVDRDGVAPKEARGAGYKWLADQLGIDRKDCHIGWMDEATAWKVVRIVEGLRGAQ